MKTNLLNIYVVFFIVFVILISCENRNSGNRLESETKQKTEPQVQKQNENENNDLAHNILGLWQCDSTIDSASEWAATLGKRTIEQSDLGKNAKLKNGNVVFYYQSKYTHSGDMVWLAEYRTGGELIYTSINKFTMKKSGKDVFTTNYEVQENTIYETMKWGKYNENETRDTFKILEINPHKLVYIYFDRGHPVTKYFSKIRN